MLVYCSGCEEWCELSSEDVGKMCEKCRAEWDEFVSTKLNLNSPHYDPTLAFKMEFEFRSKAPRTDSNGSKTKS